MMNWINKLNINKKKSLFFRIHFVILVVITLVSLVRSALHVFLPDGGAQSIATIPLSGMDADAVDVIISLFALWGLSQGMMSAVFVYILWKKQHRMMVIYGVVFFEYATRLLVGWFKPFATESIAPGVIGNYVLMGISLVALLSFYWVRLKAGPSHRNVSHL